MSRLLITDADPSWPDRFAAIANEIQGALAVDDVAIHHVGSTAVPGCAAKDCIDILIEVSAELTPEMVASCVVDPLVGGGFTTRRDLALFLPERSFLQRDLPSPAHVHIERSGMPGAVRDPRLVFRDSLRGDDSLRDSYVTLKRHLADTRKDRSAYTEAKTAFVFEALATASERGDRCGVHLRAESNDSPVAALLVADYVAHLTALSHGGFDVGTDSPPPPGSFEPPRGTFLVAWEDATPIGCGAVWEMEPGVAEIRRMWIYPSHHGRGIGRRMLSALEDAARAMGCATARLDSMRSLTSAVTMYRSQGYEETGVYNTNPNCDIWMERELL